MSLPLIVWSRNALTLNSLVQRYPYCYFWIKSALFQIIFFLLKRIRFFTMSYYLKLYEITVTVHCYIFLCISIIFLFLSCFLFFFSNPFTKFCFYFGKNRNLFYFGKKRIEVLLQQELVCGHFLQIYPLYILKKHASQTQQVHAVGNNWKQ